MNSKLIPWGAVVLGIVFLALAALYWMTPAGNVPSFLPGYEAGSTTVHFKHGLAALILAGGLFVLAWFKSGPRPDVQRSMMSDSTPTNTQ